MARKKARRRAADAETENASQNRVGEERAEPKPVWEPEEGGQCRYRYMRANGERRKPLAEILVVHRDGTIDLEVDIPERGKAANPVVLCRIPLYVEPPVAHAGVPPSYSSP